MGIGAPTLPRTMAARGYGATEVEEDLCPRRVHRVEPLPLFVALRLVKPFERRPFCIALMVAS